MFPSPFLLQLCKHKDLRTKDLNSLFSVNKRLYKIGKSTLIRRKRFEKIYGTKSITSKYVNAEGKHLDISNPCYSELIFSSKDFDVEKYILKHFPNHMITMEKEGRIKIKRAYKLHETWWEHVHSYDKRIHELGWTKKR